MPRKFLGACLFAGSCVAIAAAAMFKVTPNNPVSVPVAHFRVHDASENSDALAGLDDQMVVGQRSDRLALPPATPPTSAPEPANAPIPETAAQAQFSNAQAMASPADIEPETATPRRHQIETRHAVRHRVRPHAVTRLPETAKTDAPEKDKTAQVACANGNGFLRALNLAPACN
jgi:hypothetical protein